MSNAHCSHPLGLILSELPGCEGCVCEDLGFCCLFVCLLGSSSEIGSHSEVHAGLEFSMQHRLALNLGGGPPGSVSRVLRFQTCM